MPGRARAPLWPRHAGRAGDHALKAAPRSTPPVAAAAAAAAVPLLSARRPHAPLMPPPAPCMPCRSYPAMAATGAGAESPSQQPFLASPRGVVTPRTLSRTISSFGGGTPCAIIESALVTNRNELVLLFSRWTGAGHIARQPAQGMARHVGRAMQGGVCRRPAVGAGQPPHRRRWRAWRPTRPPSQPRPGMEWKRQAWRPACARRPACTPARQAPCTATPPGSRPFAARRCLSRAKGDKPILLPHVIHDELHAVCDECNNPG